jgi:ferredoxin
LILCFTGTGNSKYAADIIAEESHDVTVSLNEILKHGLPAVFDSEKPFVVAAPIYAWRLPRRIEELLRAAEFKGSKKAYFVVTMGSETGNCDRYCEKLCREKGLEFMGLRGVPMPDNYVAADIMPNMNSVKNTPMKAEPILRETSLEILSGSHIKKSDKTSVAWLKSGLISKAFNKYAVTSRDYVCSDKCVSCGKCEEFCPVNNITMKDGRPSFGDSCMSCYGCIHRCPVAAIDIKGKTEHHGRYLCPEYSGEKI